MVLQGQHPRNELESAEKVQAKKPVLVGVLTLLHEVRNFLATSSNCGKYLKLSQPTTR